MGKNVLSGVHMSEAGQIDIPRGQFVFTAGMAAGPGGTVSFVVRVISTGAYFFVGAFFTVGPIVFVAFVIDDRARSG